MMPLTVTLVRHGESESNLAKDLAEDGRAHENEAALMRVHTSERRLTPLGVEQAKAAGAYIRDWMGRMGITVADCRFYVSPYVRAMETAGHMQIPNAFWRPENRIVERNWGDMDQLTYAERAERYGEEMGLRKEHAFFWRPSDGETMQDVFDRYRDLVGTMHRECEQMHVIVVTHGELMWAARALHEYWSPQDLREAMLDRQSQTGMHNCRIIQYGRMMRNEIVASRLVGVRFIDSMAPDDSTRNLDWQRIERPTFSSDDLLCFAERYPHFL